MGFNINLLCIMLQFLAPGYKDRFKGVCLDKKIMPMIHKSLAYMCTVGAVLLTVPLTQNSQQIVLKLIW